MGQTTLAVVRHLTATTQQQRFAARAGVGSGAVRPFLLWYCCRAKKLGMKNGNQTATLKLYRLERIRNPDYDEASGFIVAATSSAQARRAVVEERLNGPGDEGPEEWKDPSRSACFLIGTAAGGVKPGVILRAFHAG